MLQQPCIRGGEDYAEKAALLVESYVLSNVFSGSVLVAVDGQAVLRRSFGLANREWNIPNTPDTKFRIGSLTKQFTAAAILQLAERGTIGLNTSISEYYTDAPEVWQGVSIRHLLTHMSGIPSYTEVPRFFVKEGKIDRTPQEIILITQNEPLQFEPGTRFIYSNTGYILLGYVIEKVTGHTYGEYLQRHVLHPLGMHDTGFDNSTTIIPRRAAGYRYFGGRWRNAAYLAMSLPFSAGSLYSSIDDLLVWDRALSSEKLLSASSLQAMFADYGHSYGFGWRFQQQCGHRLHRHGGNIQGFRANLDRYPDAKLTIIVLSNIQDTPADKIAEDLAAIWLL
jgi:D-alanyl-D-alanine carboxypeptidase